MGKETEMASLIPQVFFDIIARVIPGVVLLAIFSLVYLGFDEYWNMFKEWLGPSDSQKSQLPSAIILFSLSFVAAYIFSIVLWGIRYGIHLLVWKNRGDVDFETGIKFDEKYPKEKYYEDYCIVKKSIPEAGTRITKIKAEIHMTMTFSTGIALAFLSNAVIAGINPSTERFWLFVFLLVMLIGSESARFHFRDHMKRSIKNVSAVCGLSGIKE
jgi:hypothetical protein